MPKKEPLYPHMPKSKQAVWKGSLTKEQRDAGLYLVETDPETVALKSARGESQAIFDPSTVTIAEIRAAANNYLQFLPETRGRAPEFYYCSNQASHPHREIVQVWTKEISPKCPYCDGDMTYGNYW